MKATFNAPVQINVGHDLIINSAPERDFDSHDIASARGNSGLGLGLVVLLYGGRLVATGAWFLARAVFWLAVACLVIGIVLPAAALAIGLWTAARLGSVLLWVERSLGGGATRLVYVPALQFTPDSEAYVIEAEPVSTSKALTRGVGHE